MCKRDAVVMISRNSGGGVAVGHDGWFNYDSVVMYTVFTVQRCEAWQHAARCSGSSEAGRLWHVHANGQSQFWYWCTLFFLAFSQHVCSLCSMFPVGTVVVNVRLLLFSSVNFSLSWSTFQLADFHKLAFSFCFILIQCFDAVGWVTRRASGL